MFFCFIYGQIRNRTGVAFEDYQVNKGFRKAPKNPSIKWIGGFGGNIIDRLVSIDFDSSKIEVDLLNSKFDKCDGYIMTPAGISYREIKKYKIEQVSEWSLYSEPFTPIKHREDVDKLLSKYGSIELAIEKFNKYTIDIVNKYGDKFLNNYKNNLCDGIIFEDGFVPMKYIEFRVFIERAWMGFNRGKIQFRVKSDAEVEIDTSEFSDSKISPRQPTTGLIKSDEVFNLKLKLNEIVSKYKNVSVLADILLKEKLIFDFNDLPNRVKQEKRAIEIEINGNTYYTHTKDSNDQKTKKVNKAIDRLEGLNDLMELLK